MTQIDNLTLKKDSGIIIPNDHILYDHIKNDLTRSYLDFQNNYVTCRYFEEYSNKILIPRYYPIKGYHIEDHSDIGEDIEINCDIIPRNERQRIAIKHLTSNNSGILALEPGCGKTVLAIAAISHYKKKTIVITHKDKLLDNWKREITQFTNLTEDDIGRLNTKNYKECLKKPIILTTVQLIAYAVSNEITDFLDHLKNSGIGVLFVDECHVGIGPEQFSKCSTHIPAKRTYGLSATPECRNDGNNDLIRYHLGEIVYFPPTENELIKPKVFMINFPFGVYSRYKKYINYGGKFNLAKYQKQMPKINTYIKTNAEIIRKLYHDNRVTLVLGNLIKPLLAIAKELNLPKKDVGIFIPGAKENERLELSDTANLDEAFLNKQIVFSTYKAARDGNNRPDLDCLVMTVPTGNIEQAIGRILRSLSGKRQPIVIDLIDTEGPYSYFLNKKRKDDDKPIFIESARKRKEKYDRLQWDYEVINLKPKK
ncbi:MAG: DEAD/DEAH box helicase [Candidatus Woesearchaeota archaeon]